MPLTMRLTPKRKELFLAELAEHGIVARAARAASPGSLRGALRTFRDHRLRDAEFAAAWDEAMAQARAAVESELHRRAVEGWEEPIFGGRHKERIVGTVRRYSDRLMELRVKALMPEYRDRSHLEVAAKDSLTEEQRLMSFPPELRQQWLEVMRKVKEHEEQ